MTPIDQTWVHLLEHSETDYDPVGRPRLIPPILLKSVVPKDLVTDAEIRDLFRGIQKDRNLTNTAPLRAYIDGMASPAHEQRLIEEPFHPEDTTLSWLNRSLCAPRFGVIVNGAERWCSTVSQKICELFKPLHAEWGIPATAFELTFFLGNYGYTPFGIHIDDPFTNVFHFHLGPTVKTMTLWTPDVYRSFAGDSPHYFHPERVLALGETYEIGEGDVFLLPPHYYHIGNTPDFSIGLAVAVGRYPTSYLNDKCARQAVLTPEFKALVGNVLTHVYTQPSDTQLADWIKISYDEFVASEQSRCGLRYSPTKSELHLSQDTFIVSHATFPICYVRTASHSIFFIRGHRICLSPHSAFDRLYKLLTDKTPKQVCSICDYLADAIDSPATLKVLAEIAACGGLTTTNPPYDEVHL